MAQVIFSDFVKQAGNVSQGQASLKALQLFLSLDKLRGPGLFYFLKNL
jgi:hypothetical protein